MDVRGSAEVERLCLRQGCQSCVHARGFAVLEKVGRNSGEDRNLRGEMQLTVQPHGHCSSP